MKTIGIIVGSLRRESFNRRVGEHVATLVPKEYTVRFIDFAQLGIYNQDIEATPPQSWVDFREAIRAVDALLFITPEYNRSIPGGLKNALDIGSRPYGQSVWGGKPGGIISTSPGAIGGFGAQHHLRQVLTCLDVYTLQQPEAYIGQIDSAFDEQGALNNPSIQGVLKTFVDRYLAWIDTF